MANNFAVSTSDYRTHTVPGVVAHAEAVNTSADVTATTLVAAGDYDNDGATMIYRITLSMGTRSIGTSGTGELRVTFKYGGTTQKEEFVGVVFGADSQETKTVLFLCRTDTEIQYLVTFNSLVGTCKVDWAVAVEKLT